MTRQNNALLSGLSSKVSALRNVTIDIHDNARDQDSLDHSVCHIEESRAASNALTGLITYGFGFHN